ncbi:MAG: MotA/TolQ/ExbB proton channel family protein [Chromatiales bacterium]|nr:MotA/TolQ/ExbB proton channel family protein [Chromatiales bacterium]
MQWAYFIYGFFYGLHAIGIEILLALAISALLMWSLIIERYLYFVFNHKYLRARYLRLWQKVYHRTMAERRLLKCYYLSEYRLHGERGIRWIQQLSKVSLLLGLLGTVLSLIAIFESQLFSASNINHQISTGISGAIIPTTAGLLISLSGLFGAYHLQSIVNRSIYLLDSGLELNYD